MTQSNCIVPGNSHTPTPTLPQKRLKIQEDRGPVSLHQDFQWSGGIYTKVLIFPEGIQIQPIYACFLPAFKHFFPYKFHINNDDIHWVLPQRPGHSYHIYTYGPLIY
jgi:hypothetical protein